MALPETTSGTKWLIKPGDGATPEVFDTTHTCSFTSKTFAFETQSNDQYVPDCDNPDAPAARAVEVLGYGLNTTGEGVAKTTSIQFYTDWLKSGAAKNVRIEHAVELAKGGGYYSAPMKLTAFSVTANRGERTGFSATFASDGAVVWTPAAA